MIVEEIREMEVEQLLQRIVFHYVHICVGRWWFRSSRCYISVIFLSSSFRGFILFLSTHHCQMRVIQKSSNSTLTDQMLELLNLHKNVSISHIANGCRNLPSY